MSKHIKIAIAVAKLNKHLLKSNFVLKPYQEIGVKWMLDKEFNSQYKGGLLCDEPGLG